METIPALLAEPEPTLSGRLGTVHVIGGGQIRGSITLSNYWVTVDLLEPDDYGATVRCFPLASVRSVDFP